MRYRRDKMVVKETFERGRRDEISSIFAQHGLTTTYDGYMMSVYSGSWGAWLIGKKIASFFPSVLHCILNDGSYYTIIKTVCEEISAKFGQDVSLTIK